MIDILEEIEELTDTTNLDSRNKISAFIKKRVPVLRHYTVNLSTRKMSNGRRKQKISIFVPFSSTQNLESIIDSLKEEISKKFFGGKGEEHKLIFKKGYNNYGDDYNHNGELNRLDISWYE